MFLFETLYNEYQVLRVVGGGGKRPRATLEVEEGDDDAVLDYTKKPTDIDVIYNVLDVKFFTIHSNLKKLDYDKMKTFNDKI